jgi:hypothetical protein
MRTTIATTPITTMIRSSSCHATETSVRPSDPSDPNDPSDPSGP